MFNKMDINMSILLTLCKEYLISEFWTGIKNNIHMYIAVSLLNHYNLKPNPLASGRISIHLHFLPQCGHSSRITARHMEQANVTYYDACHKHTK
jgi:hypothetical protein